MSKKVTLDISGSMIILGIVLYILFFTKISIAKLFSNPIVIAVAVIAFVVLSSNKK